MQSFITNLRMLCRRAHPADTDIIAVTNEGFLYSGRLQSNFPREKLPTGGSLSKKVVPSDNLLQTVLIPSRLAEHRESLV